MQTSKSEESKNRGWFVDGRFKPMKIYFCEYRVFNDERIPELTEELMLEKGFPATYQHQLTIVDKIFFIFGPYENEKQAMSVARQGLKSLEGTLRESNKRRR